MYALADLREGGCQGRVALPTRGPNSFIFMQFLAQNMQTNNTFGSLYTPLRKILGLSLICKTCVLGLFEFIPEIGNFLALFR